MKINIVIKRTIKITLIISIPILAVIYFINHKEKTIVKTEINKVTLKGAVLDEKNNYVSLAEVSIAGRTELCTTDRNGYFTITITGDLITSVQIIVKKAGYINYSKIIILPVSGPIIITLEKERKGNIVKH